MVKVRKHLEGGDYSGSHPGGVTAVKRGGDLIVFDLLFAPCFIWYGKSKSKIKD